MKDFVEQIFTPFKSMSEHIKYRLSNPLGIAFVFSWIIFNWQAVYYFMFSNDTASSKITYLQKIYLTDKGYDLSNLLWCPLGASVLYLVVAPLVSNIATGLWSVIDQSCTALRLKFVENATLMTNSDKAKMYLALNKIKADHRNEITNLLNEISGLQHLLTLQSESNKKVDEKSNSEIKRADHELSNFELVVSPLTGDEGEKVEQSNFKFDEMIEEPANGTKLFSIHDENGNIINEWPFDGKENHPITLGLLYQWLRSASKDAKISLLSSVLDVRQHREMINQWFDNNAVLSNSPNSSVLKDLSVKLFSQLFHSNGELMLKDVNFNFLTFSNEVVNEFFYIMKKLGFLEEDNGGITITHSALDSFVDAALSFSFSHNKNGGKLNRDL
ncbi:hypothetical protein [Shewanella baltica]|uniref:hypothetical protein n=1 Tax=Shewanella baltica TaxID=62322 RepID=UPI003D7A36C9